MSLSPYAYGSESALHSTEVHSENLVSYRYVNDSCLLGLCLYTHRCRHCRRVGERSMRDDIIVLTNRGLFRAVSDPESHFLPPIHLVAAVYRPRSSPSLVTPGILIRSSRRATCDVVTAPRG